MFTSSQSLRPISSRPAPTSRLTTAYDVGYGPYLRVGLVVDRPEGEGPLVRVLAMVDSGAYRSIFPLQIAYDLGIQKHELVEDPQGGMGVGSHFRLWTTPLPIRAGIALHELLPDGSEQLWGPGFALSPGFTEHPAFLLGRADFFAAFDVTFEFEATGAVFHLDA